MQVDGSRRLFFFFFVAIFKRVLFLVEQQAISWMVSWMRILCCCFSRWGSKRHQPAFFHAACILQQDGAEWMNTKNMHVFNTQARHPNHARSLWCLHVGPLQKCLPAASSGSLKINAVSSLDETNFLVSSKDETNLLLSSKDESTLLSSMLSSVDESDTFIRGWK
jgi:hypothetical protein